MNRDVEHYLKRATRGLWGKKRLEVKEELAAHIEGRVKRHLVAGLDEAAAVQKTLTELGQPARVSAGMMSLHSLPQLAGLGALATATVLLTFTLLAESLAQSVPGTLYFPSQACVSAFQEGRASSSPVRDYFEQGAFDSKCNLLGSELWLNFETIRPILEAQSISITDLLGQRQLLFPSGEKVSFTFVEPGTVIYDWDDKAMTAEPDYFDLWALVKAVAQNPDIPLSISGWDNPTLTVGNTSFQIGTDEQPFYGEDFYDNYLNRVLFGALASDVSGFYTDIVNPRTERIAKERGLYEAQGMRSNWSEDFVKQVVWKPTTEPTSSVYGLVVNLGLENPLLHEITDDVYGTDGTDAIGHDRAYYTLVVQANADGSVSLDIPANEPLQFVDRFSANSKPGEAILVELTADAGSWFKVVPPEQISVVN